ncbi:hypothetical protein IM697_03490 [Streptomyces ferrugineus]|uniref:Uncharacterized protein n=1 Tax=Streptomyces ferrugineus TaxID=1413221 RepID=A0A7M2SML8_9ACTN|nr:hypothetical protein [Streptomyces ferrugineus]QOV37512.1 hypothetical protein IM697_03490 [Streptomyces ferrugineus]
MTLRVYTVDRHGAITEERGCLDIVHGSEPLPLTSPNLPCRCPRHRAGQPVVTR